LVEQLVQRRGAGIGSGGGGAQRAGEGAQRGGGDTCFQNLTAMKHGILPRKWWATVKVRHRAEQGAQG
jgi:hypothetical protein